MIGIACALLVSVGLGVLPWLLALGRPLGFAGWTACIGSGYVLGALLTGVLLRWADPLPPSRWPDVLLPMAGGVLLFGGAVVAWRQRRYPPAAEPASPQAHRWPAADHVVPVI